MAANRRPSFWTPLRLDQLRVLVLGGMTFRRIAPILGCTVNAAIGAAYRRHYQPAPHAPLTAAQRNPRRMPPPPHNLLGWVFPPPHHCLWPRGHPNQPGFSFCAEPVPTSLLPYCTNHCREAYHRLSPGAAATHGGTNADKS